MTEGARTAEAQTTRRPAVTVSYAQTLDGRLATANGASQWISCPESLVFAHEMRASHDAVMIGVGTACADDPRLTVRHAPGDDPLRVVVDSSLRLPPTAAVLANKAAKGTVLAVTERAPKARREEARALGARVLKLPEDASGRVDLGALMMVLRKGGVRSVMVEGGAALITSLFYNQLVDRLAVCVAPKILGRGMEAIGDLGICELVDSIALVDLSVTTLGVDLILDARVVYPSASDEG